MRWKLEVDRLTHWPVESTIFQKLFYARFLAFFLGGFKELFLQLYLNEPEDAAAWLHHFLLQEVMVKPKKRTEKLKEDFYNSSVACTQN